MSVPATSATLTDSKRTVAMLKKASAGHRLGVEAVADHIAAGALLAFSRAPVQPRTGVMFVDCDDCDATAIEQFSRSLHAR